MRNCQKRVGSTQISIAFFLRSADAELSCVVTVLRVLLFTNVFSRCVWINENEPRQRKEKKEKKKLWAWIINWVSFDSRSKLIKIDAKSKKKTPLNFPPFLKNQRSKRNHKARLLSLSLSRHRSYFSLIIQTSNTSSMRAGVYIASISLWQDKKKGCFTRSFICLW